MFGMEILERVSWKDETIVVILRLWRMFCISDDNIYDTVKEYPGLPWWCSGWGSACQCRGHGFKPWSGRIPHAAEQLGPWATATEPARLEPVLRNKRGRDGERPAHRDEEWPPLAATREGPSTETETQRSNQSINQSLKKQTNKQTKKRVSKAKSGFGVYNGHVIGWGGHGTKKLDVGWIVCEHIEITENSNRMLAKGKKVRKSSVNYGHDQEESK